MPDRVLAILRGDDERTLATLNSIGMHALRASLAVVYVWFGALKVAGVSPAADLVARTVPFLDPGWFVPMLGLFEVGIGVCLLRPGWFRRALPLYAGHLLGTFLVLVELPGRAFAHGDPLLLTMEGEFVVKNLVLLTAGVVVGTAATARAAPVRPPGHLAPWPEPPHPGPAHLPGPGWTGPPPAYIPSTAAPVYPRPVYPRPEWPPRPDR